MLLLIKYTLLYGIVLMLVALGGMFSEHSGIINIALEGIMVIGGVAGVLTLTIVGVVQLGAAALAEIFGDDHGNGGGQQVQCCTADGLVCLQVDGGKRQQQAVNHARQCRHQNRDEHHKESAM